MQASAISARPLRYTAATAAPVRPSPQVQCPVPSVIGSGARVCGCGTAAGVLSGTVALSGWLVRRVALLQTATLGETGNSFAAQVRKKATRSTGLPAGSWVLAKTARDASARERGPHTALQHTCTACP
jgi:hypothetical protein